jgi:hypothetical protein
MAQTDRGAAAEPVDAPLDQLTVGMVKDAVKAGIKTLGRSRPTVVSIALCCIVLAGNFLIQLDRLDGLMPYPQHIDEHHLTNRAANIIQTGNFNQRFFNWPALPFHMTTAAMIVGYIKAARNGEVQRTADIGSVSSPYYTHPTIMWPIKILSVMLLVGAAALMGITAFRYMAEPALLYLVPFGVLCSSLIFVYLPSYSNPDTFGVFFIALLYLYLSNWGRVDTMLAQGVGAGVLCGLVISCKYPLVLVLLAPSLAILCWATRQRLARIAVVVFCCFAAFFVVNPFVLSEFTVFLDDIGFEVHHYSVGRVGSEGTPGISQFTYHVINILRDFGPLTVVPFVIGCVGLLRRSWKSALVVLVYPAAQLVHFSTFAVRFSRNIAFIYALYATMVAVGFVVSYRLLVRAMEVYWRDSRAPIRRWTAAVVVVTFLAVFTFRVERPLELMRADPDSRKLAVEWMRNNASGRTVVIPEELPFDTRGLEPDVVVRRIRLRDLSPEDLQQSLLSETETTYLLIPSFDVSGGGRGNLESVALADRLNRLGDGLDVVKRFGHRKVMVNWRFGTEGSPAISIARIAGKPGPTEGDGASGG